MTEESQFEDEDSGELPESEIELEEIRDTTILSTRKEEIKKISSPYLLGQIIIRCAIWPLTAKYKIDHSGRKIRESVMQVSDSELELSLIALDRLYQLKDDTSVIGDEALYEIAGFAIDDTSPLDERVARKAYGFFKEIKDDPRLDDIRG